MACLAQDQAQERKYQFEARLDSFKKPVQVLGPDSNCNPSRAGSRNSDTR